jgi:hypothetical protein
MEYLFIYLKNEYQVMGTLELFYRSYHDGERPMTCSRLDARAFCSGVLSAITQQRVWNDGRWRNVELESLVNVWVRV